jgi:DNA repair exonuclease SbcCD nuclease subunit
MKILFTGDWHIHPYPQYARPWKEGLNSRAKHIYEVVGEWLPRHLGGIGANGLVHAGDWNWSADNGYRLVNLTREAGYACESSVDFVIALHGNHDTLSSDPDSHNAFPYLRDPIWVPYAIANYFFFPVGYNDALPQIESLAENASKAEKIFFILHKDIEGGEMSNGFVYKDRGPHVVKISELFLLKRAFPQAEFIAGHYHKRQTIRGLVRVVGAPVQHNAGDEGASRGFLVYDSETNDFHYDEPTCLVPKFVSGDTKFAECLFDSLDPHEREYVYFCIHVKANDSADYAKAEKMIEAGLNATIKTVGEKKSVQQKDTSVSSFSSDAELLDKWFREREPDLSVEERAELIKIAEGLQP